MQKYAFTDGGFCLHDLRDIVANGRVSAWYDARGQLLDSEYFPAAYPDEPRRIPRHYAHAYDRLQRWGRTMRHAEFNNVATRRIES